MRYLYCVLVFYFVVFLYLPQTIAPDVFQVSEAREGVVIQEILRTGEFILPLRHGEIIPSKPPFFHWLASIFQHIFNFSPELMLRLPSLLSGAFLLSVIFCFTGHNFGNRAALRATIVAVSSYSFLRLSTDGRVDMLFNLLSASSIFLWLNFFLDRGCARSIPNFVFVCSGMLAGTAVLVKGPLGLILPLLVVGTISLWRGGVQEVFWTIFRPGWLLALVLPLGWYLFAWEQGGDGFIERVFFENVGRFSGTEGISKKPIWFYFQHIWLQFAPWSFLILLLGGLVLFKKTACLTQYFQSRVEGKKLSISLEYLLAWVLILLFFFSLSSGKRRGYLLVLVPPLSILLSLLIPVLSDFFIDKKVQILMFRRSSWIVWWLLSFVGMFLFLSPVLETGSFGFDLYLQSLSIVFRENEYLLPVFVFWLLVSLVYQLLCSSLRGSKIFLISNLFFVISFIIPIGLAAKGLTHSYKDFALEAHSLIKPGQTLTMIKAAKDESFESLYFYYPRRIALFDQSFSPREEGHYLARESWFLKQSEAWQSTTKIILKGGRRKDQPKQKLVLFIKD